MVHRRFGAAARRPLCVNHVVLLCVRIGLADRHAGPAGGDHQRADGRRQPDRDSVVHHRAQHPPADQLLHRVAGRQRPAHRAHLYAVLYRLPTDGPALAARADPVRPVAVARLHRLSVFDLHGVLHHHRPVLFRQDTGQVPQLAHRRPSKRRIALITRTDAHTCLFKGKHCALAVVGGAKNFRPAA